MKTEVTIGTAHSRVRDAREAVREIRAGLPLSEVALVVFFCSSRYDLDALADEINRCFGDCEVVGCTTAGEIGPSGYCDHSLSAMSFPKDDFTVASDHLDELRRFDLTRGHTFTNTLLQKLEAQAPHCDPSNSFGLLLIDGLSVREESVVRTVQHGLGQIKLLGGSAGDDAKFRQTWVFSQGQFRTESAVLVLMTTPLPFKIFKTQHFVSTEERLVVTEANPARRIVKEINGLPAAEEYARVIGVDASQLDAMQFARWVVVVVIDGADYVRSIQKANPDGSLTFYCAIEEGLVFRVARGNDLVANLNQTFESLRSEVGPPQAVLACDCFLRHVEITQDGLTEVVGDLFQRHKVVGFNTYGEQFGGVHVNQTLTGIAFGARSGAGHD